MGSSIAVPTPASARPRELRGRRATTHDQIEQRDLGASRGFSETLTFGYRIALERRVEITPSLGLGVKTEVDASGRLPPWTRGAARIGITVGWFF